MTPLPAGAAAAVVPAIKKVAQTAAKKAAPVVVPLVVDAVKPLVPEPDQWKRAAMRVTATGRLSVDIDGVVSLTEDIATGPDADPNMVILNSRALKLRNRYKNAVRASGQRRELLEDIRADLTKLRQDIDAALR